MVQRGGEGRSAWLRQSSCLPRERQEGSLADRVRLWLDVHVDHGFTAWSVGSSGWDLHRNGEHLAGLVTRDHAGSTAWLETVLKALLADAQDWTTERPTFPV